MTPHVARLTLYPFKSLDGADVGAAKLTAAGGFFNDRRFAFVDADGACVNGKREPKIHLAGAEYDAGLTSVTIVRRPAGVAQRFALADDGAAIAAWVGEIVGRSLTLAQCDDGGFPDDAAAPGPTVISAATIATVAGWFPGMTATSMRRRLRANIEIDGVPPFWEDRLYGAAGTTVPVQFGPVTLWGTNPCQRCIVPSRDPDTAAVIPAFSRTLAERRESTLPAWAERARFNHFYRLAVNTLAGPDHASRTIRLGDPVVCGLPLTDR